MYFIFASWLFFSSFFLFVNGLSSSQFISIVKEPWEASLSCDQKELTIIKNGKISVPIVVENRGTKNLLSTGGANPVFLSYHINDSEGKTVIFDGVRFAFSDILRANQQEKVVAVLDNNFLNLFPGKYVVEFDLVKEGEFWFEQRGTKSLSLVLIVKGDNNDPR